MQRLFLVLLAALLLVLGVWVWSRSGTLTAVEPVPGHGVAAQDEAGLVAQPTSVPEQEGPTTSPASRVEVIEQPPLEAPLRGRLLDRETGEPVPWYELRVAMGGKRVCRVETDAEGRFETPIAYPEGTLQLSLEDVEGQASSNSSADLFLRLEHDPSQPEQELEIGVGPTLFLHLQRPDDLALGELRARIYLDPPLRSESTDAYLSLFDIPTTVVRPPRDSSDRMWVRFRQERGPLSPLWLAVESLDGLWRGGARIPSGSGVHPDTLEVVLHPRCAARGRFVSSLPSDRGGALIALYEEEDEEPLVWAYADDEDGFRIADLDPGGYRLEVRDEAFRAPPVRFTLSEGELDLGELTWEPIAMAGPVRLRLRSAVEVPIDVELVRTSDPPRFPLWHSDSWEELPEGGYESLFEWEEVYAGEYAIEVHCHDDVSWHLALGHLEPPVDDLVRELPVPDEPLRFEVRAQDGGELAEWELWVRGERIWERVWPEGGRLASLLFEDGLRWSVWSPGYRGRTGGLGEATWPGQGERTLHVALRPGWSRRFQVRTRARWEAVPDAEVWLDGALAGTTDARGELLVERDSPPMDWEVRHATLVWLESGPTAAGEELEHFVVTTLLRPR
jgi:hypothetical protein